MIKLELSQEMINIIGQALGNAPYNIAAPVIAEIHKQINAQPTIDGMAKEALEAA